MQVHIDRYITNLATALAQKAATEKVPVLAEALRGAWSAGRSVYLCGNGGSAGNAIHLANDLLYGVGVKHGVGMKVEALSANAAVITCLANDIGYERVYSEQVRVKGEPGDVLIVLSGSGNSPNVVQALETGNAKGMQTFAILGFTGGKCAEIAQVPIHFAVDDMQVAEDLQLVVIHMCMQWLCESMPVRQAA